MNKRQSSSMNRREFLKVMGVTAGALTAASWSTAFTAPPAQVGALPASKKFAPQYRGTSDGQVFMSPDGGQTWQLLARLGEQCNIQQISVAKQNLVAQIIFYGIPIVLKSADGRTWYSWNYQAPK